MERRLAAILATDVVGFTRLMAKDEAGTLSRLLSLRNEVVQPSIDRHKGRIVKLVGDGVLAEFPSIVEAVGCAVEICDETTERDGARAEDHRLQLRIGVHIGDVIIEGTDIYGDGVNLASRLEQIAEPGGICISAMAYEAIGADLKALFEDQGEQTLKNIDKPVRVWHFRDNDETASSPVGKPEMPEFPSIAVIPFMNISSDPELDFLADGLAEDIISLLARLPGFFVIARTSTMAYRSDTSDVRKIGRELGARYIVEGSIRPIGNNIRVTAQLIDSMSGNHLWAERYDVDSSQLTELQDDLTTSIVACLQPELTVAESQSVQRKQLKNLDAWSLYRQGSAIISREGWNERSFDQAAECYRQAIRIDPEFAPAHALLSLNLSLAKNLGYIDSTEEANVAAETALNLDSNNSEVLGYVGCAIADMGRVEQGIEILERAIELNPSNAQAWAALGAHHAMLGDFDKAVENLERSVRLSPRDPRMAFWGSLLALARSARGEVEQAIVDARAACRRDQKIYHPRIVLTALLLKEGRIDEARSALTEALRIRPNLGDMEIIQYTGNQAKALLAMKKELMDSSSPSGEPSKA